MKLFTAVLGFALAAVVAGNGLFVEIKDVEFRTTPDNPGNSNNFPAGTVVTVQVKFTLCFTNLNDYAIETWITHIFNGPGFRPNCEYGYSTTHKGYLVPAGFGAFSTEEFTVNVEFDFPTTLIHLFEPGNFDAHLQLIVERRTPEGDIITIADESFDHTLRSVGNIRKQMCMNEEGDDEAPEKIPPGYVTANANMNGSCFAYTGELAWFDVFVHVWYWNYYYVGIWVPMKVMVEDEAGHYYYIYVCIYIPARCSWHIDFWIFIHVSYPVCYKNEWFGWLAYCDLDKNGYISKFNHAITVVDKPPDVFP